eukprot:TRINITY_DN3865_c0_g1_i1.p1 TRINITY_DN3865_c0_g1~~TRINITY_DN3865_c0_g1_i1.p1  ORF type:complete len:760 (+),score=192.26 TRINITY_DN3865_c0_g1_i1:237-2516(+)
MQYLEAEVIEELLNEWRSVAKKTVIVRTDQKLKITYLWISDDLRSMVSPRVLRALSAHLNVTSTLSEDPSKPESGSPQKEIASELEHLVENLLCERDRQNFCTGLQASLTELVLELKASLDFRDSLSPYPIDWKARRKTAQDAWTLIGRGATSLDNALQSSSSVCSNSSSSDLSGILKSDTDEREELALRNVEQAMWIGNLWKTPFCFVDVNETCFPNQHFAEALGLCNDDVQHKPLSNLFHRSTYQELQPHIDVVYSGKEDQFDSELILANSHRVTSSVTLTPNIINGRYLGFAIFMNIKESKVVTSLGSDEFKIAEHRLDSLLTRVKESEENRKKQERFLDSICHEIRNPLCGIYGSVIFMREEIQKIKNLVSSLEPSLKERSGPIYDSINQMQNSVNTIDKCSQHQKALTDDVLNLSKLENNKLELNYTPFKPKDLVDSVMTMFQPQFVEKKLELIVENLYDFSLIVCGDPDRLAQVMVNLISNSLKFTHYGGITLRVTVAPVKLANTEVTIDYEVIVSVHDTGIGISKEQQNRIFDRFSQASRKTSLDYGGSGLGLSIAKNLVSLMGGNLSVESERFKGSTFTFSAICGIPTDKEIRTFHALQHKRKQILNSNATPTRRILIVEDNAINQKVIERFVTSMGHIVVLAENGQAAMDIIEKSSNGIEDFDLVFMDIMMPVMDGIEATKRIRKLETKSVKKIPIIGLSGNARREQIKEAYDNGFSDYITKPYDRSVVLNMITEWTQVRPLGRQPSFSF